MPHDNQYIIPLANRGDVCAHDIELRIQDLQKTMIHMRTEMPEVDHFFAPGIYGRRFPLPADMLVVGRIHKHEHLMMLLKGRAQVITAQGNVIIEAGYVGSSPSNTKRVVYGLEDCLFMTIHHNPNNITDIARLEAEHIIDEPDFKPEYHHAIQEALP